MDRTVKKVSGDERLALERLSAATLPNSPAQAGMKPDAIRAAFWQALTKGEHSVTGLIDRVIGEVNDALAKSVGKDKLDELNRALYAFSEVQVKAELSSTEPDVRMERVQTDKGEQITLVFQLPRGKGLEIARTFPSVDAMHAGWEGDGVEIGDIVMIDTDVNDEDNAELYVKGENGYVRIGDLSGARGIQGPIGPQGPKGKDGTSTAYSAVCNVVWDAKCASDKKWFWKVCSFNASNEKHVLADLDFRIVVGGVGFRYSVNLTYPYGQSSTRMIFVKPRVMFENEASKTLVDYFRIYEAAGSNGCRDLWVEVCTDGTAVQEAYAKVLAKDDDTWPVYSTSYNSATAASKSSGYDSLTVYSADWGNKNAVLSLDSRATAEGATVGGDGNRVEAKNAASFGKDCSTESGGTGTVQGGEGCVNRAKNVTQVGENLVNDGNGHNSAQFGSNHYNNGIAALQAGTKHTNTGDYSAQFGHTMKNDGDHVLQGGWNCFNDIASGAGFNYVDMWGSHLLAARVHQFLRGIFNEVDPRALAIWANGTSDNDRKNVFTIAASGTPEVDTDGITLKYLSDEIKKLKEAFVQKETLAIGPPVLNEEKKLTEGAGYYFIMCKYVGAGSLGTAKDSHGVIYWDGGITEGPAHFSPLVGTTSGGYGTMLTGGAIVIEYGAIKHYELKIDVDSNSGGYTYAAEDTQNFQLYTKKIGE